ncbi:NnrS family protein [Novosphingobium sediminicola]|uniref:Uncharacterized protein involved in response to NO n=1 Tax=Novosphingobium sediminicola TaxID=563162 RepID=A0A7W6CIS7_9SPHN|nr:uncharacterized protein involved in response to NO [Novosphingobium sediminicola]
MRQLLNDLGEMIAREIIAGRNWRNLGVLVLLVSALAWIMAPSSRLTALALAAAGVLHLLHLAYAFLPVGALVMAVSAVVPAFATNAAGQHWWMAGCIAMMTMAVMTRATRGHTGHDLAGIAWIAGFAGFCLRYGPMLLNRRDGQPQGQNPLHAIRLH